MCSERTWRGGEQQIAYLVEELRQHDVENVVALKKESALQQYCLKRGIRNVTMPFSNSVDLISAKMLRKICETEKVDLIHMHTSKSHGIGVLSAWLGNNTPLVLSRRVDFEPKTNVLSRWKYNHPNIKRIIGVSNKITEIMQRHVRDKQKCITIYSGIDLNKFSSRPDQNILRNEYQIPRGTMVIGNTAALAGHKDYFTFIDTVEILALRKLRIHAFIIGEGPLEAELKDYVLRKGLQYVITFTGFRKNITEILQCLDIFLMPSKEEGLGTSILDAFLAGVPVVATAAGGIPEMVHHEVTGLLAPVGDSKQLAGHIQRLIQEPDFTRQLIARAHHLVEKFSKQNTARETLIQYKQILSVEKESRIG